MATGIIGEGFVFHTLFVDGSNTPVAVSDPAIEVFYFDANGSKQTVVGPGEAMTAVVGETGRYKYSYDIPGTFDAGDSIYGKMTGEDPATSELYVVEQTVDLVAEGAGSTGMIARFVRGG
jgi:hypothetical protein